MDFVKGKRTPFVCYFSNELRIHRTKLENADSLYNKHKGGLLSPPGKEYADEFPEFYRQEFSIREDKTDIVFSGLGWIMIPEGGVVVRTYVPKGVSVYLRDSLI